MISVHVFGLVTSKDESKKSIKLKNILILILFAVLHTIINLYLDYCNNFITPEGFGLHYGLDYDAYMSIIDKGRELNNNLN